MKMVISNGYGPGFFVPQAVRDRYKISHRDSLTIGRDDPILISYIENEFWGDLAVVNVPDNATDYKIYNYDGCEWVVAVVDGKLVEIRGE